MCVCVFSDIEVRAPRIDRRRKKESREQRVSRYVILACWIFKHARSSESINLLVTISPFLRLFSGGKISLPGKTRNQPGELATRKNKALFLFSFVAGSRSMMVSRCDLFLCQLTSRLLSILVGLSNNNQCQVWRIPCIIIIARLVSLQCSLSLRALIACKPRYSDENIYSQEINSIVFDVNSRAIKNNLHERRHRVRRFVRTTFDRTMLRWWWWPWSLVSRVDPLKTQRRRRRGR